MARQKEKIVYVQDPHFVRTIEQTGKRYKFYRVIGALFIIASIGFMFAQFGREDDFTNGIIAVPLFIFGAVFVIGARIGSWWYHG